ncbi:MAG: hypothetical protein OEV49_12410 [candidate division Zixibacteria bacterium]|nr:hypothetical protein [candidate division Zixibacteria bacterium]MDH3935921.1 hypothetical protein [candidate division Zixibacteria bacterium]MDH4034338.1 hypothetical protein [candidate division Zixibacteria bacterium]
MPFILKAIDDTSAYERFESVLIIPCRFCPAASAAVMNNEPYFEVFRRFLKTGAYERFIKGLKSKLEKKGIETDVFKSRWLHQFVLCMWTSKRRAALKNRAKDYDALVVLGCEAAVQTVRDSVKPTACEVLQGVETEGIMSVKPRLNLPCNLSLEPQSISKYEYHGTQLWGETG